MKLAQSNTACEGPGQDLSPSCLSLALKSFITLWLIRTLVKIQTDKLN